MLQSAARIGVTSVECETPSARVAVSHFQGRSGVDEYHLMLRPEEYGSIGQQLETVYAAYRGALGALGLDMPSAVMRRFFCSDLTNQATVLEALPFSSRRDMEQPCAVSWVGQPPMPPARVALWAYHVSDPSGELDKRREGPTMTLRRGELTHCWTTGISRPGPDNSYGQARDVLQTYEACLRRRSLSLADNVIRTWLFVQNVDANYQGMVTARRELFAECGLTADTHFIASTGVEGASADLAAKVTLDAYAIAGIRREQITFLAAPDYLSPTQVYGATFERGVTVAYQDRKHILISGTASIDRDGRILYPGDVSRQLDRTLVNVGALLEQAGATFEDVRMFIVYVRDPSDLAFAWQAMRERFGEVPTAVAVAAVCRPGWLIEVECQAILPASSPRLPAF
jgi:enamine deaminase RidA (YjgF/YER057c/UK114 family)